MFYKRHTQYTAYQIYRHVCEEGKHNPHPNVLPVVQVSEVFPIDGVSDALFPLCIMTPWMPDGNITQYVQMKPEADRLMLVRVG